MNLQTVQLISDSAIYACGPHHARFADVVRCRDGSLLLSFVCSVARTDSSIIHGDDTDHVVLMRSTDGGRTWIEESTLPRGEPRHLTVLRDGRLLRWNFPVRFGRTADEPVPAGAVVVAGAGFYRRHEPGLRLSVSEDNGRTWSAVRRIVVEGAEQRCFGTWGAIIELAEQQLLWPVYASEAGRDGSYLLESNDGGQQWKLFSFIAWSAAVSLNEPFVLKLNDSRLVAFLRSESPRDYDATGHHLYLARSEDGGSSWSAPQRTAIDAGSTPVHALRLGDGRILLSYGFRRAPYGLRVRVVDADCAALDDSDELIVRQDGDCWDLGYPRAVTLATGDIFVAYYFCPRGENRQIRGCLLRSRAAAEVHSAAERQPQKE